MGLLWAVQRGRHGMRVTLTVVQGTPRSWCSLRLHPAGIEMSAGVLLASSFYSLYFMHTADFQGSLFPPLLNCF